MVPDVVRQFFETYRDAFVRFDAARVAASYHVPSIMARGDSYALWATDLATAPFTHFGTIGVTPSHGEGLSGATPTDLDDYTADPGPTLTMSGPKDGSRSANGMGGTRAVG